MIHIRRVDIFDIVLTVFVLCKQIIFKTIERQQRKTRYDPRGAMAAECCASFQLLARSKQWSFTGFIWGTWETMVLRFMNGWFTFSKILVATSKPHCLCVDLSIQSGRQKNTSLSAPNEHIIDIQVAIVFVTDVV